MALKVQLARIARAFQAYSSWRLIFSIQVPNLELNDGKPGSRSFRSDSSIDCWGCCYSPTSDTRPIICWPSFVLIVVFSMIPFGARALSKTGSPCHHCYSLLDNLAEVNADSGFRLLQSRGVGPDLSRCPDL